MSEWMFLGERTEAEVVFQPGLNRVDGQYYRFEPIATRLKGNAVSELRQVIEKRFLPDTDRNQGIVSAIGPIFHQERLWLGWKDRNGQNLFASGQKIRKPFREELADLYPLIKSYQLWHQLGLTVGRPEWRRLLIDQDGLYMLDPKPALYLNQPCFNPPIALERCRPAEEYRRQPPGSSGDIFYLGLIIYYYLTGEVPFGLCKGWPTQRILAGQVIDPRLFRPELPIGLGRMIMAMLNPEPSGQPAWEEVDGFWNEYLKLDRIPTVSRGSHSQVRCKIKNILTKTGPRLAIAISISVLTLLLIGSGFLYSRAIRSSNVSPLKAAANFYQEMGRSHFNGAKGRTVPAFTNDFDVATKRRLELVNVLLSKPVFEVGQMRIVEETPVKSIVEADLIWWEWAPDGWARRQGRERLVFRKTGKKLTLESRSPL